MAHEFTEDQIDGKYHKRDMKINFINSEFKDAFELFDKTGEGMIQYCECAPLARCFGFNPTDTSVSILLGGGDEDNQPTKAEMQEKSISFDDFLPILWAIANSSDPGTYEDFFEGLKVFYISVLWCYSRFKVFDKDGGGFISSAELRHVLSNLGEKLTSDQVSFLLDGQEDLNGMVNYDKFIKQIMSDSEKQEE